MLADVSVNKNLLHSKCNVMRLAYIIYYFCCNPSILRKLQTCTACKCINFIGLCVEIWQPLKDDLNTFKSIVI